VLRQYKTQSLQLIVAGLQYILIILSKKTSTYSTKFQCIGIQTDKLAQSSITLNPLKYSSF